MSNIQEADMNVCLAQAHRFPRITGILTDSSHIATIWLTTLTMMMRSGTFPLVNWFSLGCRDFYQIPATGVSAGVPEVASAGWQAGQSAGGHSMGARQSRERPGRPHGRIRRHEGDVYRSWRAQRWGFLTLQSCAKHGHMALLSNVCPSCFGCCPVDL